MASAGRQYVSSIYGGGMGVVVDVYPTNFFEDSRPSRLGGYSLNGLIPWLGLFNPSLINEQTIVEIMPKMGGWSHQRASATVDIGWELMTSCSCFWSILVSPISHNHPPEDPSWIVRKSSSSRGGLSGKPQGKKCKIQGALWGTYFLTDFS